MKSLKSVVVLLALLASLLGGYFVGFHQPGLHAVSAGRVPLIQLEFANAPSQAGQDSGG